METPEIGQPPADQPELQPPTPDRIGGAQPERAKETPLQPPVAPIDEPMGDPPLPNEPAAGSGPPRRA